MESYENNWLKKDQNPMKISQNLNPTKMGVKNI